MKKIFTFIIALMACASISARDYLPVDFVSWGDGCVVDGNTVYTTEAWKGAGNWLGHLDLSAYDCIVMILEEPSQGDFKSCVQYSDPTTAEEKIDDDGDPYFDYKVNDDWSVEGVIPSGTKIVKFDLNPDHSDLVAAFWVMGTTGSDKLVIKEIYVGTNEEYEEDLANNQPVIEDPLVIPLSGFGSWGNTTWNGNVITATGAWGGAGKWYGNYDASDYDKFVLELEEPTTCKVMLNVVYNKEKLTPEWDEESQTYVDKMNTGIQVAVVPGARQCFIDLDERKNDVQQVSIQIESVDVPVKVARIYWVTNANFVEIPYVPVGLKGDIDNSGEVNTGDVTVLYNVIFGTDTTTDATICDINGDGEVNTGDVTELYNIIFGTAQ